MTDDALPNGMRMLQRVQVYSGIGRQGGVMAAGQVIGWLSHPAVIIRGDDGQSQYVSSQLEWEEAPEATPTTRAVAVMRATRKARGLSAEALAERVAAVGVPWERSIVANLENGRRASLTVDELVALSKVLEVPVEHFLFSDRPEE